MGDNEDEDQEIVILDPRVLVPQRNQGPLIRIVPDNTITDLMAAHYSVYLNYFAVLVFRELPLGGKNHVICPAFIHSSFCKIQIIKCRDG